MDYIPGKILVQFFNLHLIREYLLVIREPKRLLYGALFFLMILLFFPLAFSSALINLPLFASGLIWIALLLALLLSTWGFFEQDNENGVLEQWILSSFPLSLIVSAKLLLHCLATVIMLCFFSPLLALLFHFSWYETGVLVLSLCLASPGMIMLCGLAAAFTTRQSGILMALILFPLTLPLMIFGSGAISAATQGQPVSGIMAMLLAISLITLLGVPPAISAVLRISLND